MRSGAARLFRLIPLSFLLFSGAWADERWIPVGPPGGDVRSLAFDPLDPRRIYLGTADGVLYGSDVAGLSWQRLDPGFPLPGHSLDEIVVTPDGTVIVGFWDVRGEGGGVAVSSDRGRTFVLATGLEGESVRALALAPSDPRKVFAGTLGGVFASADGGLSWRRISPLRHQEIRNVESLAVDPRDSNIVYAGTWHLPWKTVNGGATWTTPHSGMIDDSDVFTITLDRRDPRRVFATACSGIYRSPDEAAHWTRARGIKESARRTRAFAQDLTRPASFYAGTTEGLWLSEDDSLTWRLTTAPSLVVNTLLALPDGTVLLGAESEGVLRSRDQGRTWNPSNAGFSERPVRRISFDPSSQRVFLGLFGERGLGAVMMAASSRGPWMRLSAGLQGREVLSLAATEGRVLAGTDDGLYVLGPRQVLWKRLTLDPARPAAHPRVSEVAILSGGLFIAVTSEGVFRSADAGLRWRPVLAEIAGPVRAVATSPGDPKAVVIATRSHLWLSDDSGATWRRSAELSEAQVNAVALLPGVPRVILVASTRGLFRSSDFGEHWTQDGWGLPHSDLSGLAVHPDGQRAYVSDFRWGGVYRSDDRGLNWTRLLDPGVIGDRVWTLGFDPAFPDELLVAPLARGLHLITGR